jgi:hypothetical protein
MVLAIIVVIAVVAFLAVGRGGELSAERADYVPLDLGPVSATDVALLRPPTGMWGYDMQATDEAMKQVAESIRERDVRIVALEQLVTDLSRDHAPMPLLASPYVGARHRRTPAEVAEAATAGTEAVQTPYEAPATEMPATEMPATEMPATGMPATGAPATGSAWPPFEPTRPPFDRPRPSGDVTGPPERSHD